MGYDRLCKGRISIPNQIYFVTVVTKDRANWFVSFDIARLVIAEMRRLHESGALESLAWVLMPDHLHWLIQLGESLTLAEVIQRMKGRSSVAINRGLNRSGSVWQRGYYDHALRKEEDMEAIARYIVANPLRAGLAMSLREYPLWDAKWL